MTDQQKQRKRIRTLRVVADENSKSRRCKPIPPSRDQQIKLARALGITINHKCWLGIAEQLPILGSRFLVHLRAQEKEISNRKIAKRSNDAVGFLERVTKLYFPDREIDFLQLHQAIIDASADTQNGLSEKINAVFKLASVLRKTAKFYSALRKNPDYARRELAKSLDWLCRKELDLRPTQSKQEKFLQIFLETLGLSQQDGLLDVIKEARKVNNLVK